LAAAGPSSIRATELYERYAHRILAFCLHRLGSREEAEDAAQTTFLNAFRGLERGVVPELEQAWLFTIAERVCLTRRRSSSRRRRVESPSDLESFQDLVPSPERVTDELIPLSEALAELPPVQRRALLLREWHGLSYREIAAELGVSQSAVETLLFRSRRALAKSLVEPSSMRRAARRRAAG
jgi:RNA polymerase sigma-70 factor (ECF subfamily)